MKKFVGVLLFVVMMFGVMPMAYAGMGGGGTYTPDPKYLPYSEVGGLSEGLAWYCNCGSDDNYGFIDTSGKVVIQAKYEEVGIFQEGLAAVKIGGKWGYIDKAGKEVIALEYEDTNSFGDGLAYVKKDNKFGYIDKTGKEVIKPQYDHASKFSGGLAAVQVNHKWVYIDKTGKEVIKSNYDDAYMFSEGLAGVQSNGKWGFVDQTGKEVIKSQYDKVYNFSEGLAPVQVNGKWGFIDKAGKEVITPQYVEVYSGFSEGLAVVFKENEGTMSGYIDKTGKEIIKFEYDFSGTPFSNGLAVAADGGQGSFYFIANPLSSSAPVNTTAVANEKRIDIKGSNGSYITITNVIKDETNDSVAYYIANAPVTVTFHGDDLIFENIATVPAYEKVKFAVKKYVHSDDKTVFDELLQQPDVFKKHFYISGNYSTLSKPGDYDVAAAPQAADGTNVIIHVTGDKTVGESTADTKPVTLAAAPTASKVLVNRKEISFEAYNIGGNNYFKLRDLGAAVNGTEKNFQIGWDGAKNAISLEPNKAYTPTGGELVVSDNPTSKDAKPTSSKIYFDGKEVQLTAYNIAGNNYFKLRDIAEVINFGVTWDEKTSSIGIDTKSVYKE